MKKKTLTLDIPSELYDGLKSAASDAGFDSLADFVLKKLEEVVPKKESLSEDDEEKVKERLKALGYMD